MSATQNSKRTTLYLSLDSRTCSRSSLQLSYLLLYILLSQNHNLGVYIYKMEVLIIAKRISARDRLAKQARADKHLPVQEDKHLPVRVKDELKKYQESSQDKNF